MADPKGNIPLNVEPSQEQDQKASAEAPVAKVKSQNKA
jgi:hypothetical protein